MTLGICSQEGFLIIMENKGSQQMVVLSSEYKCYIYTMTHYYCHHCKVGQGVECAHKYIHSYHHSGTLHLIC